MRVLSSYRLSEENNRRIGQVVSDLDGTFARTTFEEDLDTIIQRIEDGIGDATVFLGGRLTQEQLDAAEKLQWIHVPWAGVNALFRVEGFEHRDILISNSKGIMADSVADQVMAYLIMLNRNLANQIRWAINREWKRYMTVEHPDRKILRGMTVGIAGFGAIGEEVARRADAFGMNVIAMKRQPSELSERSKAIVHRVYGPDSLDDFLGESDFVVVALPLTDDTHHLFGTDQFAAMKKSAYLVNVSRGKIVDEPALIQALEEGVIAGAALDVFEEEPLPEDSRLWDMDNVIVTPHSSGGFVGFGNAVADLFIENLRRFGGGEPLLNRVDPGRGY